MPNTDDPEKDSVENEIENMMEKESQDVDLSELLQKNSKLN